MRCAQRSSAGDGNPAHTLLKSRDASSGASEMRIGDWDVRVLDIYPVYYTLSALTLHD